MVRLFHESVVVTSRRYKRRPDHAVVFLQDFYAAGFLSTQQHDTAQISESDHDAGGSLRPLAGAPLRPLFTCFL